MTDNQALVIIPARGGSKGIPRKNIKEFCGRPLIHYSIEVAKAVAPDTHIILSTDDDEIRHCATLAGLPVSYRRPAELGGDKVGSREVILDPNSNLYFNRGYAIICGYVRKPWIFQTKRGF